MYHGNLGASVAARLAPSSPGVAWNVRHSLDSLANEKPATRWVIRANRWLSKGPDRILYNSRVARLQHERFGFEPRRAELIPNGFQIVPEGRKGEIARSVRRQLGIPAGAVVVGHAARFHAMKDHALFLRSAASVAADRANLVFVLCGTGVSAENDELIRWIPADLRDRFWLLGERNDLSDLMAAMDILCLSSAWGEAFPNVLGEAMAMGTPCLATDVGDSQFLLAEAGRVVAPRDEAAFTAGLAELVNLGPEKRRSLGEEARARVASEFSMAGMVQRYGDLFQWLAEDPAGA
jgi:glycosyltransferase involved in cell wall biosynthesis